MNTLDVVLVEELIGTCQYFWETGWGKCHAENISYLLLGDELDQLKEYTWVSASVDVTSDTAGLKGKASIVIKSGVCFRTMKKRYERDLGIIQSKENGYNILWGLDQGRGRPTSELPAHILCYRARLADDASDRIVMHYHPTCLNVMTMIHELDEESFTQTLWKMNSECVLMFPEGSIVLSWMKCRRGPIGPATVDRMEDERIVVWPFHGVLSSSSSISDAIGLIKAINKDAHVYVLMKTNMMYGMTDEDVQEPKEHPGPS